MLASQPGGFLNADKTRMHVVAFGDYLILSVGLSFAVKCPVNHTLDGLAYMLLSHLRITHLS